MRKFWLSSVAVVAAGVLAVSAFAQAPPPGQQAVTQKAKKAHDIQSAQLQSSGPVVPFNYATGFEPGEGFAPGFIGTGAQGSGGYPEPWGATAGGCANTVEGHIDTVNPAAGVQHLRLSDFPGHPNPACVNMGFTDLGLDARVPPSPPQNGLLAPTTMSVEMAMAGLFGSTLYLQPQDNNDGFRITDYIFAYNGFIYIIDETGSGATVQFPNIGHSVYYSYWDVGGGYHNVTMVIDPCTGSICIGGANAGLPCVDILDCPGADECAGTINYYYAGELIHAGSIWAGDDSEQWLAYTDNWATTDVDFDDMVITTGSECPSECGNMILEAGEECDAGAAGSPCPGLCVAVGGTGRHGEPECTCDLDHVTPCDADDQWSNDVPVVEDNHGGWFTWEAHNAAYGVSTCGNLSHDSAVAVWTGTCDSLALIGFNDDCDETSFGDGSDPLASCYDAAGVAPPWPACTCVPTTINQQYWAWDLGAGPGNTVTMNRDKRKDCGALIGDQGACCDSIAGVCTDNVASADCAGNGMTFFLGKACSSNAVGVCEAVPWACCDHVAGSCTMETLAACNPGGNVEWSKGSTCADVDCFTVRGACCVPGQGLLASCSQETSADCDALGGAWSKSMDCADIECGVDIIPTVSEWGLVIMTLLLLAGAKVYFGRRQALA